MTSDQENSPEVTAFSFVITYGLSILLLWFCVNGSPSFDYRALKSGPDAAQTITDSDASERNIQNLIMVLLVAGFAATRANTVLQTGLHNRLVFVAPLAALFSAIWSQDPAASVMGGFRLLVSTTFAIYLSVRFKARDQMRLLIITGAMFCVLNAATAIMLPQYGVEPKYATYAWRGMASYKNVCAYSTVLLTAPAWFLKPHSFAGKLGIIVYVIAQCAVVWLTASVTGIVMVTALVFLWLLFSSSKRMPWKDYIVFSGLLTFGLAAAYLVSRGVISSILSEIGKGSTLNGRTTIWAAITPFMMEHPIGGYGYHAFWRGLQGQSGALLTSGGWYSFAHNGYLEVMLELGLLGLVPLLLMFSRAIRNFAECFRSHSEEKVGWYAATMILVAICNVPEGTLLVASSLGWIVFVVSYIGSVQQRDWALTHEKNAVRTDLA